MGKRLVLEGEMVHDLAYHEWDVLTVGGETVIDAIEGVFKAVRTEGQHGDYYTQRFYGNVRITIERLDDED